MILVAMVIILSYQPSNQYQEYNQPATHIIVGTICIIASMYVMSHTYNRHIYIAKRYGVCSYVYAAYYAHLSITPDSRPASGGKTPAAGLAAEYVALSQPATWLGCIVDG